MFQVIHPPYKKGTLACIACLCFEIGVCPWPDLSALFQYTSPTPVVSLHLIPRIQYHPGIPVTLLTRSSSIIFMIGYCVKILENVIECINKTSIAFNVSVFWITSPNLNVRTHFLVFHTRPSLIPIVSPV